LWSRIARHAKSMVRRRSPELRGTLRGQLPPDLALRVYSSRLIGRDPSLVLHGGGNSSVKTRLRDDTGKEIEVLCVKGSGWDLADIEPAGLPRCAKPRCSSCARCPC